MHQAMIGYRTDAWRTDQTDAIDALCFRYFKNNFFTHKV
jgi:phage tail protein X